MLHATLPTLCLEPLKDLPVPLQEHALPSFMAFRPAVPLPLRPTLQPS